MTESGREEYPIPDSVAQYGTRDEFLTVRPEAGQWVFWPRSVERVLDGLYDDVLPLHVELTLTYECNFSCQWRSCRSARERTPDVLFHLGDMTDFDLGKQFDVVTCLFSSIGYVKTLDRLQNAVRSMAAHLKPGGALVVEPWCTPENWHPNTVHALFIDEPELKIASINTSFVEDRVSVFDLHYLIGTPEKTEHLVEHHEMGLFEVEETMAVMEEAGLTVNYDADGLTGRGLYIGRRKEEPNKTDPGDA